MTQGKLLGTTIGRIRLIDFVGTGGVGEVYLGFDETLERLVAVKAIRSELRLQPETRARFFREARMLSQLEHPNICRIYDLIEGEDNDCLVLELIDGQSLREKLAEGIDDAFKMRIIQQIVQALKAVHGHGVIHRDLKPENVMITGSEEVMYAHQFELLAKAITGNPDVSSERMARLVVRTYKEAHQDKANLTYSAVRTSAIDDVVAKLRKWTELAIRQPDTVRFARAFAIHYDEEDSKDLLDFVTGRILDHLGIPNDLVREWGDDDPTD